MLFDLDIVNNIILPCFFFIFLIIYLYFLITAVIAQVFNPVAKLVILIGISTKETKEEMKTHAVIVEAKKIKCSV